MIDIAEIRKGDKVHYQSDYMKKRNEWENGIVKSVSDADNLFVVYHCNRDWDNFEDYTADRTDPQNLHLGWKH